MKRPKRHVLVVDDFKDTRDMYGYFLSLKGFGVTLASNGQDALEKAIEHPPDLVIMDLSMPVMNGWEATQRLKADERTKHIAVVMLTASPMGGLTPALAEAGFEAVLIKPCMPDQMVAEIDRVLTGRRAPSRKSNGGPAASAT